MEKASENKYFLVEGNILKSLITLSLPIMGTSFLQTAYNLTDMLWLGRAGSKAVAAVGTAGFYTWLSMAFIMISKIGGEVCVAQSVGQRNDRRAKEYIRNALQLNIIIGLLYSATMIIFRKDLIGFFKLGNIEVSQMASDYLLIVSFGIPFNFVNQLFTGVFNGYGNSRTPFKINLIGLGLNMLLDPLLIHGIWVFPRLGVVGAAVATIIAQIIPTLVFLTKLKLIVDLHELKILKPPRKSYIYRIVKIGLPTALQNGLFTIFSMLIARIISRWGEVPIAVQKVGAQIESLSWVTAGGFSTALSAFVGQNYGAKRWDRIYKGYFISIGIMGVVGILTTILLVFYPRPIFSIFIPEEEAINYGVVYLKILGLSQLFMCLEITTAGAFNGLGRTIPPSVISILFTGLRVPAATILSSEKLLGLDGIWWSISISSVFKGILLTTWFITSLYKNPNFSINKGFKAIFSEDAK